MATTKSIEDLREEIVRLAPWHYLLEITPELDTRVAAEGAPPGTTMPLLEIREPFHDRMRRIYPEGLQGRSVLDCACNCGAYLFWAKEIGAGACFGFDVREHWIEQGRFLLEHRTVGPSEGVHVDLCDLYELPKLGLEPFDVALFQGIFYHLPEVIRGLKIAADLTRELIVVNTASWNDFPDGFLAVGGESTTKKLSGVYGLNWYPTGPRVVARILAWLGFPEVRLVFTRRDTAQRPELGRLEVIAAREPATLERWDAEHRGADPHRVENLADPLALPQTSPKPRHPPPTAGPAAEPDVDTPATPPAGSGRVREAILELAPWHYNIQVTPEVSTIIQLEARPAGGVDFLEMRVPFHEKLGRLYPDGLQGRTVLDCACNCGGYLFWAKEAGAGECFGFDVREHWLEQARFLLEHRTVGPSDGIQFERCDLYELPKLGLEPFDVTLFQGILYHLPDAVQGLRIAAELTRELILVNTATWNDVPDGFLSVAAESPNQALSGVYGLNWYPTGPKVVASILMWLGFPESRLVFRRRDTRQKPELGRVEVIAARDAATLAHWDAETPEGARNLATALGQGEGLQPF